MAITLDQARGVVRGVRRDLAPNTGGPPGTGAPGTSTGGGIDWNNPGGGSPSTPSGPTTGGGTTGGVAPIIPPGVSLFNPSERDVNETVYQGGDGIWRNFDGTPVPLWQQKMLDAGGGGGSSGSGGSGGSSDPYAASREARAQAGFDSDEAQRRFANAITWQELLNSQKYADRNFGLDQTIANRNEMGNRAGTALSFADFALADAERKDALANDPGNFPAWLQAMQGNQAVGPTVQSLVGQGVAIQPQQGTYLDDPMFQKAMQSVLGYAQVPSGSGVDRVQAAYNEDADRAQRWFEAAAALDAGKGMALGGVLRVGDDPVPTGIGAPTGTPRMGTPTITRRSGASSSGLSGGLGGDWGARLMAARANIMGSPRITSGLEGTGGSIWDRGTTQGPMRFQDLTTGETVGVAGEAGPETVSVTPSEGTARALGRTLGAGGFSFFPIDVRQKLEAGQLPLPSELPDWVLSKLPPSIQQMFAALVRSRLGGAGAQDFAETARLYEPRGFSGLSAGVVR